MSAFNSLILFPILLIQENVKCFSINSINRESWLNDHMHPRDKSIRHQQFNSYVYEEVIPFIRNSTSWETPIVTCGASFGALHSANLFFRRPDIINGVIAMSGDYELSSLHQGISRYRCVLQFPYAIPP